MTASRSPVSASSEGSAPPSCYADFAALFQDGAALLASLPGVLWTVFLLWWRG